MGRIAHIPVLDPVEPLDTYLSRLAAVNGASSLKAFRSHMRFGLERTSERPISVIADLTGIDPNTLASQHMKCVSNMVSFRGERITAKMIHWSSPRYCPHCVTEDLAKGIGSWEVRPRVRVDWVINEVDYCTEHATHLFTSPVKYAYNNRYDFSHYLRHHRPEMEAAALNAETNVDVHPYDRYFSQRLRGENEPFELLDPLPYYIAARLCATLGRMVCFAAKESNRPPIGYAHESRRAGFELMADREKLMSYLSELKVAYLGTCKPSGGRALYGDLQDYLERNLDIPELRPFIDMVRESAMETLPIGPEDKFLGSGGIRRWHTLHTAMSETGLHSTVLRKLLIARGTIAPHQKRLSNGRIICSTQDVEAVATLYRDGVDSLEIGGILGLARSQTTSFLNAQILKPIIPAGLGMDPKYSRSEAEMLVGKLLDELEQRDEEGEIVSIDRAHRKTRCPILMIINALLDGRLPTRFRSKDPTKSGFAALLLSASEIMAEFVPPAPGMKRSEFNRALKLDNAAGKSLFDSGLFAVIPNAINPVNRVRFDVVTQESFDDFCEKHATLAELAKGWMRPSHLRKALDEADVMPVWAVRKRRAATFYRKSDVEAFKASLR